MSVIPVLIGVGLLAIFFGLYVIWSDTEE